MEFKNYNNGWTSVEDPRPWGSSINHYLDFCCLVEHPRLEWAAESWESSYNTIIPSRQAKPMAWHGKRVLHYVAHRNSDLCMCKAALYIKILICSASPWECHLNPRFGRFLWVKKRKRLGLYPSQGYSHIVSSS